jgi:hypothetical protein
VQALEVAGGIAEPIDVVDADAVDLASRVPAQDGAVDRLEHLGILDPHGRQPRHPEEPPVVEVGPGPAPRDQVVVLQRVHLARGTAARAERDRETVFVVAQLAALDRQVVERVRLVDEDRDHDVTLVPVDVEPAGVRRRLPEPEHVPPGRVGMRHGDTDVVRDDVGDHAQLVRA